MKKIEQTARDGVVDVLYFDEAGFACLPSVQRSWTLLGQPHTADANLGKKRAHVIGALNYTRAQLHCAVCDHAIGREDVVRFIDQLAPSSPPEPWTFLVLDNASTHHHLDPAITDRWLVEHRFLLLYLPPYSPGLNLIEIL